MNIKEARRNISVTFITTFLKLEKGKIEFLLQSHDLICAQYAPAEKTLPMAMNFLVLQKTNTREAHNLHDGAYPRSQTSLSVHSPPGPPHCDKGSANICRFSLITSILCPFIKHLGPPHCDKGSGRIGCVSTPLGGIPPTFTPITGDIDDRQQENIVALHNKLSKNKYRYGKRNLNSTDTKLEFYKLAPY